MIDYKDCQHPSCVTLNLTNRLKQDISNNKKSVLVAHNSITKRITEKQYNIGANEIHTSIDVFLNESLRGYDLNTIYFDDFVPSRSGLYEIIQFDLRGINCVIRVTDPECHGQLEKHQFFYDYISLKYPEMLI